MVYELFEIGKKNDLEKGKLLHFFGNKFTKFSAGPPYRRLSIIEALHEEQEFFSKVSNYDFEIEDLRIDIFLSCSIAIATFILHESGEIVAFPNNSSKYDYNSSNGRLLKIGNNRNVNNDTDDPTSFYLDNFDKSSRRSRRLMVKESVRGSLVFLRLQDSATRWYPHDNRYCKSRTYGWEVIHEHFSRIEKSI